jgi:hypothetical protein
LAKFAESPGPHGLGPPAQVREKPGRSREGGDPEGARLDCRSNLGSGTQHSIYARWPLLETNFAEFKFYEVE